VDHGHVIEVEHRIGGHEGQSFELCLGDEQSVEWVTVMSRQLRDSKRVRMLDGQTLHA